MCPRLSGNGKLRFVIQTNWRDLAFPNWLLEMLDELASRSIGVFSSATWGEQFAFHAVAFLLHRQMECWKLDDHHEVINASCLQRATFIPVHPKSFKSDRNSIKPMFFVGDAENDLEGQPTFFAVHVLGLSAGSASHT